MTDSEKERQLSRKGNIGTVSSDRLVHVDVQHCNQESASFATQSSSCVGERYTMTFRTDGLIGAVVIVATRLLHVQTLLQLPDTTGIDGHLTANRSVDHFFSLWLAFNNDDVKISG